MSTIQTPGSCPRCQQAVRPTARFCDYCGLSLSSEDTDTAILDGSIEPAISSPESLSGLIINSKYKILGQIGVGGMGKVYRARRLHIGDEVVIKLLDKKYVSDAVAAERFRREAQAAAKIRHQNVVIIHDFGEADDEIPAYIVMELVVGVSLKDILQTEGHLSVERTISLMREICRGVGAGHSHGVIHRDIKPGNIIVSHNDESRETAKVVDFGLAKIRDETGNPSVTQIGVIVGTPLYMSPEQCRGEAPTIGTDVYSLGILTYQMLAGFVPFSGGTSASTCMKHQNEVPPSLPKGLAVPKPVESVLMRALAKDPNDRQVDAAEYSRDLQAAFEDSRRVTVVGNMQSTVEDPPTAASGTADVLSDLDQKELTILSWSFRWAMQRRHNDHVEVEYILDQASQEGMDRNDVLRLLDKLTRRRLIEVSLNKTTKGHFDYYSLNASAFEEYARVFVDGYDLIKKDVILCIVNGTSDNLSVADSMGQPQPIVDQIFHLLSERELIAISRRLGGKLIVTSISAELLDPSMFISTHN
jgi:serine/threonine-protein kinase